jgi:hypothetical protein
MRKSEPENVMNRHWKLSLLLLAGLTVAAAFATGPAGRAVDPKAPGRRGQSALMAYVSQFMQTITRAG